MAHLPGSCRPAPFGLAPGLPPGTGKGLAANIKTGDKIQLGGTVLRFVAFCGEDFNWEAPEEPAAVEPKKE